MIGPIVLAATSPLLAWRDPIYVAAGFAGVAALSMLLLQPLLTMDALPGLQGRRGRRAHAFVGAALVVAIVVHVGGLWMTSPPDVIDALTFQSPTPFAVWGVASMWAAFAAALLAAMRRRLRWRPGRWRSGHVLFVVVAVVGAALHALLIEGAMEPASKTVICALAVAAATAAAWGVRRRF